MDAQVENRLGDSISYSLRGAASVDMKGFVSKDGDIGGAAGLDPMPGRWYCKLSENYLPDGPARTDRLTHPRLPGTMRPVTENSVNAGQSWVFELQKV